MRKFGVTLRRERWGIYKTNTMQWNKLCLYLCRVSSWVDCWSKPKKNVVLTLDTTNVLACQESV